MNTKHITSYTAPPDLLQDRVLLITGAGNGIGRALAKASARLGARVVLLDRNLCAIEGVYDEIEDAGSPPPALYPLDLEGANMDDYAELAATIKREYGRLDGLVNNAGWVSGLTPVEHYDMQRWMRVMMVNLNGPFALTHACLGLLKAAPDPSIVFSTDDCQRAYWGAYGVAKQGVLGLMRILAAEYQGDIPIRVNAVDPGVVATDMRRENYPGEDMDSHPAPEAVVGPYLYLLGPDSRGVTGLNVELGRKAQT